MLSKTDGEVLKFVKENHPKTEAVAVWMKTTEAQAEARLTALKLRRKLDRRINKTWKIFGEADIKPVKDSSNHCVYTIDKTKYVPDETLLRFIDRYKPLTADVATWMGVTFLTAAHRLEHLKKRGLIDRLRAKHPWRLHVQEQTIRDSINETIDNESEQIGRLIFTKDENGRTVIRVKESQNDEPLTSDEILKILEVQQAA